MYLTARERQLFRQSQLTTVLMAVITGTVKRAMSIVYRQKTATNSRVYIF
jgi:hypothetical protein